MWYYTTFGASNSHRFVRDSVFCCEGRNFDFTGAFVTFGSFFSSRFDSSGYQGTDTDFKGEFGAFYSQQSSA